MPYPATPTNLTPNWAGEFDTFVTWVNKAPSWIDNEAVCIDNLGRRCRIGGDFMRARDENAFPVRFFWDCEPAAPSPAETLTEGVVLHTKDGRKIGNAVILECAQDGEFGPYYVCQTDFGNKARLTEGEIHDWFYVGTVADLVERRSDQQRLLTGEEL